MIVQLSLISQVIRNSICSKADAWETTADFMELTSPALQLSGSSSSHCWHSFLLPIDCDCCFPRPSGKTDTSSVLSRSNADPKPISISWLTRSRSQSSLSPAQFWISTSSAFISFGSQVVSMISASQNFIPKPAMFQRQKTKNTAPLSFPHLYQMPHSPDKYPLILLSRLLNFCLYFNLEAWGTAQSVDVIFGEFPTSEALEEEFEL